MNPLGPVDLDAITSVLLADGWHPVAPGTLYVFYNPRYIDAASGDTQSLGGPWLMFASTDGAFYGVPLSGIVAAQWTPPAAAPPPAGS